MTSRSDDLAKARQDLAKALTDAKAQRDKVYKDTEKAREKAEAEMWQTVDKLLDNAYHGARTDATKILDYTRDHILKQTKKYKNRG